MITDTKLSFILPTAPVSLVGITSVRSPLIIDLMGVGVGLAPPNIIGNANIFATDPGVTDHPPQIDVSVGTAATTGTAATLNVQFQGAPDTGAGGGYQPGTWTTIAETGPIAVGVLASGAIIARFPFMPFPITPLPRYLSLNFVVAAGTSFTAGSIAFAIITWVRDDNANKYATNNYVVAG